MRLTPSQVAMNQMLGHWLPMLPESTLKDRIKSGHDFLVEITEQDFGFDLQRWHDYLRTTNAGGYRWSNKHLGIPKRITEAMNDPDWCRAVEELQTDT